MDLDTQQLEAYLDLLEDRGIEEFECKFFRVRFTPKAYLPMSNQPVSAPERRTETKAEIESLWESKSLWGPDGPPTFPGTKKK